MQYVSTRGEAPQLNFSDTLLTGLATDGGLYVPQSWPQFSKRDIKAMRGKPYADVAFAILQPFVDGEIPDEKLKEMIDEAYGSFRHKAVTPMVQTDDNAYLLELFHGPTLAFKDVAMQLLARMMDYVLEERNQRATIVGATSGDTGGAAIEAFANRDRTDIFILFPHNRVSPVQQRQMTTSKASNVHSIAIEGTFDDCQDLVKAMFNHQEFRNSVQLSGVNSINWGRIMAQIVYYFTASLAIGGPERKVSFTVPTGNFGDIFAGYCAKRMGLPIAKLNIATNDNDILARTLKSGTYEMKGVNATSSPSMDIQISSNFERLLFEAYDRDASQVRSAMGSLKQSGSFSIEPVVLKSIRREFAAAKATGAQVGETISKYNKQNSYVADPHTAVGLFVAEKLAKPTSAMITLATAHPAKFPSAVKTACGINPALPNWLSDLMEREERFKVLPAELKFVEEFISMHTRASQ